MKPLRNILVVAGILLLSSCFKSRDPMSDGKALPPVTYSNQAVAEGDQPPITKTDDGFVVTTLPGISPTPPIPLKYTTYIGPSN